MRDILRTVRGLTRIEISGAFPEAVLNACAINGVEFRDTQCIDTLTIRITVAERDVAAVESLAAQSMCDVKILSSRGGKRGRAAVRRRKFLLIAFISVTALALWSSMYIWDIEIDGCREVTRGEVMRLLDDNGVGIGTYWPEIDVDTVRSRIILQDERIAWMTVNVRSSKAHVVIHERLETPELIEPDACVDIIAGHSGVIRKMSVLQGQPTAAVGQAVYAGDVLVSGTVESITNPARQVHALGEIWADTWYELCAKCPAEAEVKTATRAGSSRFALVIGENRINFYISSRNDDDKCDKITHTYKCAIAGVFTLPVALVREEFIPYESEMRAVSEDEVREMCERLYERLDAETAGGIQYSDSEVCRLDGTVTVTLRAQCLEDIAVSRERP